MKKLYMPFQKVDAQDDGTVIVIGIASSEAKDSQGEIIKASAMQAALPDFFKYGTGNLREMHQPLAAGTVDEATIKDGVTTIEVTVVDPVAVQKVLKGVYKGFSIGGSVTERDKLDKTVIVGMRLSEISLVDRPANPDAVFEVFKADGLPDGDGIGDTDPADKVDEAVITEELHEEVNDTSEEPPVLEFVEAEKADGVVVPVADIDALAAILDKGDVTPAQLVKVAENLTLHKGMYQISAMAELLVNIKYLAEDAQWEAEWEDDGSPVPAKLRAWLNEGIGIFNEYAAEETAELSAGLNPSGTDAEVAEHGAIEQADKTVDLAKFDAAQVDDKANAIIKGLGFTAGAPISDVLGKMAKRITELEAMPTVGKALLNSFAITKAQDNGGVEAVAEVVAIKKADGTVDDVATMIKSIHSVNKQ